MRGLFAGRVGQGRDAAAPRLLSVAALATLALLWAAAPASAAPTWLAPQSLSPAGVGGYEPQVALDPEGDAVAVWVRSDTTSSTVQAASREAGGAWSAPVGLSGAGVEGEEPQVAIDARGEAVAVWSTNGAHSVIQAATKAPGGAWSAPVGLSAPDQDAYAPQIALDAAGDAVVTWVGGEGGIALIQAATRKAGGAWSTPVTLSAAGRPAREPQVAIDRQGDAVVVWERFDGSREVVQASSSAALGAWSAPVDLSAAGQSGYRPQVALDAEGGAAAVWQAYDGVPFIQASSRPAGGGWLAPVDLSAKDQEAAVPRVAINPGGEAVATWQKQSGTGDWWVEAASRPAAAGWSPAARLSAAGVRAEIPTVGIDAAGNATVLWQGWTGTAEIIQAAGRAPGGAWSSPAGISTTGQPENPQLAVGPDGDAAAVWADGGESGEVVQAALLDATGPRLRGLGIPASGTTGQVLSFSVSPLDAFSALGATTWAFGDGTTAVGTAVTHAYAAPGSYAVTVTGTDAVGNASTATGALTIGAATPGPVAPPIGRPAPRAKARAAARAKVKDGKALLRLACPASGACKGRAVLGTRVKKASKGHGARKKVGTKLVTIGTAQFSLRAGAHATVRVKLTVKGRKLLNAAGRRGLKTSLRGVGVRPRPVVLKAAPPRRRASRHG